MITERFEPDRLSRAELDDYLARGWYRIGRAMITTDYLVSGGQLRSTIWTRLDLYRHTFRPSLRKQMARNARLFRIEIGPHAIDAEREDLYARYREMAGGNRAESLDEVLGGEEGRGIFDTREVRIYLGDRLVAFSWFDLGETSVQSLIGVYDPDHRRHGLGFYTMLLEIAHAAGIGMRYHYSGYVLSGHPSMDYKLRVGDLDYLDPATKRWIPDLPFSVEASPAEVRRRRLGEAAAALTRAGHSFYVVLNSALQIAGLREQLPGCTTEPILLICPSPSQGSGILTVWDEERGSFALLGGMPVALTLDAEVAPAEPLQIHCFIVQDKLGEYASAEEVAFWIRVHLG